MEPNTKRKHRTNQDRAKQDSLVDVETQAAGGEQLLSSFSQYLAHADYQQNWGLSKFTALYTGP